MKAVYHQPERSDQLFSDHFRLDERIEVSVFNEISPNGVDITICFTWTKKEWREVFSNELRPVPLLGVWVMARIPTGRFEERDIPYSKSFTITCRDRVYCEFSSR